MFDIGLSGLAVFFGFLAFVVWLVWRLIRWIVLNLPGNRDRHAGSAERRLTLAVDGGTYQRLRMHAEETARRTRRCSRQRLRNT